MVLFFAELIISTARLYADVGEDLMLILRKVKY